MKKIIIIGFITFLTVSQFIFGQQATIKNDEESFLQQIESSAPLPGTSVQDLSNTAQIQQTGNNNYASINQTIAGMNIPGNLAELIQNGDVNNAVLIQNGSGNNHNITQTGDGNILEATVLGDDNLSVIDQFGNYNIISQNLIGKDMSFIISQIGNNNEISQTENDQQSRKYDIQQNGNEMKLIIINGGILP